MTDLIDALDKSQKPVRMYQVDVGHGEVILYEVRFSNMLQVVAGSLEFIKKDSAQHKRFCIIFNARHVNQPQSFAKQLTQLLMPYKNMFLDPRLHKFAIMVENFLKHRVVIEAFDAVFETPDGKWQKAATPTGQQIKEGKLRKYEFFSTPKLEIVRKWVLE